MEDARKAAERVARESYGKLIAILAARSRDIAGAEDALNDALVSALKRWPIDGVPSNPDAWLLTAARNRMKNVARHQSVRQASEPQLAVLAQARPDENSPLPDERLKLMFVCAHPAIEESVRAPLMLQTILGLDAARICNAFLVAPATMGQRLVRAKAKIRDAKLRFEPPEPHDLPERLSAVLDAIYAAYGVGWDAHGETPAGTQDLTHEAIYLCRVLVSLLPEEPEPKGLLALMLYCEARRAARYSPDGAFVPLERQDARLWSRDLIIEAEGLLTEASRFRRLGRFQCEAAIQSVHIQRPITGATNYNALLTLYRMLVVAYPSAGAKVGLAAVLIKTGEAAAAMDVLDEIPTTNSLTYQPYWVARGEAQRALGMETDAKRSLRRAIELTETEAVSAFLRALVGDRT